MQQFKDFLKANQVDFTDADITTNLDWIKSNIKAELFTAQFGQLEGLKVRAESDPEISKALTFMPEALALEDRTKGHRTPPAWPTNDAVVSGKPGKSGAGDRDRTRNIQLGKVTLPFARRGKMFKNLDFACKVLF